MTLFIALTDDNTLVSFDPNNSTQTQSVSVTGIEGTLLGIDMRPANGKIYGLTTANKIYTLDPNGFDSGRFEGNFTLTDAEEAQFLNDAFYVNLHTNQFNGGELRGQVNVELEKDIVESGILLEESQEVGSAVPDGPAMGAFDLVYDDATNTLKISGTFSDLTSSLLPVGAPDAEGNPQSAIHLHRGKAGENGPIIRNFTVTETGFGGTFTLTDEEEALLLDNALYVNLHTDGFAGGELRGQVNVQVENDVVVLGTAIEEAQQVGAMKPPDGPAMGSFDVAFDNSSNQLFVSGTFKDLTSPLLPVGAADGEGNPQSAIHIHNGAAGTNGPIVRNLKATDNVATLVSTLSQPFEGGTISGFDFNPVPDRLRLVGDNDQNFRINVDTGEVTVDGMLAFADGDKNSGVNPNITASAYINSFAGATTTQLFNIDTLLNTLVLQNPPNNGTLVTIGELGVDFDTLGGFDILSSPDGTNAAFAVSDSILYAINLETGAATKLAMLDPEQGSNLQGLTILPKDDLVGDGSVGMDGDDMGMVEDTGNRNAPMDMPMLEYGMTQPLPMHTHDMTHVNTLAMSSDAMGNMDFLHHSMPGAMA